MVTMYSLFCFELLDFSAACKTLLCFCYLSRDILTLVELENMNIRIFFLGKKEGEEG